VSVLENVNTWRRTAEILAPAGAVGCFGDSVAVQRGAGEETRIFVGAPVHDGTGAGRVYVFSKSANWALTHTFEPSQHSVEFGWTIAANEQGGLVYILDRSVIAGAEGPVMRSQIVAYILNEEGAWRTHTSFGVSGDYLSVSASGSSISIGGLREPTGSLAVTFDGQARTAEVRGESTFVGVGHVGEGGMLCSTNGHETRCGADAPPFPPDTDNAARALTAIIATAAGHVFYHPTR